MSPAPPLPPGFLDRPFAHRGLHGAGVPENSRAAVAAAVAAGYGIELDLQPASDATPMVFHDATLERMTEARGPIAARTADALGRIPVRGGTGESIPTLVEILDIVDGRVPLLLELKDQSGTCGPGPETLEPAVAGLLLAYGGPVAVMSFNPAMVAALADHAPALPRGLVTCAFDRARWPGLPRARARRLAAIADATALGAAFVSHDHRDLGAPAVAAQRRVARAVLCWTIRSAAEEAAARRHADAITFEGYRPAVAPGP